MVRQYKGLNNDLKVLLNIAKDRLAESALEAKAHRDPRVILARVDHQMQCIMRIEKAVKS